MGLIKELIAKFKVWYKEHAYRRVFVIAALVGAALYWLSHLSVPGIDYLMYPATFMAVIALGALGRGTWLGYSNFTNTVKKVEKEHRERQLADTGELTSDSPFSEVDIKRIKRKLWSYRLTIGVIGIFMIILIALLFI